MIDLFMERYEKEFDFYETASKLAAQQIEQQLQSMGIRAIVTSRAKSPASLKAKVLNRNENRETPYACVEEIYEDLIDLAGVRIALYFPSDRMKVDEMLNGQFEVQMKKSFPQDSNTPSYQKRFSGYWANHYRVLIKENHLEEINKRYVSARIEIQVASVLMHAWSEVEHDLVYKPLSGNLSPEELKILDEINGLVLSGEIALERLQEAGELRIKASKTKFNNQYELATFLQNKMRSRNTVTKKSIPIGDVEVLFELASYIEAADPSNLAPFLKSIVINNDNRTVCEQIIDQLILGNEERYKVYNDISNKRKDSSKHEVLGVFIDNWIKLETQLRELSDNKQLNLFSAKNLSEIHIFDKDMVGQILQLRNLRNNIVHGIEVPDTEYIADASKKLSDIIDEIGKNRKAVLTSKEVI